MLNAERKPQQNPEVNLLVHLKEGKFMEFKQDLKGYKWNSASEQPLFSIIIEVLKHWANQGQNLNEGISNNLQRSLIKLYKRAIFRGEIASFFNLREVEDFSLFYLIERECPIYFKWYNNQWKMNPFFEALKKQERFSCLFHKELPSSDNFSDSLSSPDLLSSDFTTPAIMQRIIKQLLIFLTNNNDLSLRSMDFILDHCNYADLLYCLLMQLKEDDDSPQRDEEARLILYILNSPAVKKAPGDLKKTYAIRTPDGISRNVTLLMLAFENAPPLIITRIIELKGVSTCCETLFNRSELMFAAQYFYRNNHISAVSANIVSIIEDICEQQPELLCQTTKGGRSPLMFFMKNIRDPQAYVALIGIIKYLLAQAKVYGYDIVNMQTNRGETAVMIAAKQGQLEILKLLVSADADLRLTDKNGKTAYDYAIKPLPKTQWIFHPNSTQRLRNHKTSCAQYIAARGFAPESSPSLSAQRAQSTWSGAMGSLGRRSQPYDIGLLPLDNRPPKGKRLSMELLNVVQSKGELDQEGLHKETVESVNKTTCTIT